jgi:hypothetical protein
MRELWPEIEQLTCAEGKLDSFFYSASISCEKSL